MAKRRTASSVASVPAAPAVPSLRAPAPAAPGSSQPAASLIAGAPGAVPGASGSVYDDQTGLDLPLVGRAADPGRNPDFPQFGQIGHSGLLSVGGILGSAGKGGASRVFNPERISLFELDEMSLDPVIRSCLLGYTLILQTAELSVSCADASMKALIESQFLSLMPQLIRETVRPAMVFGWADAEIVWQTLYNVAVEVDAGEMKQSGTSGPDDDPGDQPIRVFPFVTTVKDYVPLSNATVTLRQTLGGDFAGAVQWGWGESFLPPSKLFHLPLGGLFRNPYGESAIKGCYPFWYWTRFLYEMLMVAVERGAAPPVLGRYPVGYKINVGQAQNGTTQQVDAGDYMLEQLAQLRSFSTAVFPRLLNKDGKDLYDVQELPLDAHIDWLMDSIQALNAQKQLYMFFPDKLLQSGDIGSYALAKEHTDLFSLAIQAKLDEILDHVNKGPLRQFVRYNDAHCPPAKLTYSAPNIQAMQSLAQSVVSAITGGQALVTQNQDKILVPDWKRLADQFGIPYTIVRRMDGADALGNPLQPGADPDAQDHASAQAAGLAPSNTPGSPPSFQGAASGPGNAAAGSGNDALANQAESADDYLSRVLGTAGEPAQAGQAQLWDGPDREGVARLTEEIAGQGHAAFASFSHAVALGSAPKNAGKAKFTSAQVDLMQHLYAAGPTSHADIKTALPSIPYPHQTGGYLADHGLLQKVKHPETGKAAFQMTEAGKEALATHMGWTGAPAPAAATVSTPAAPLPLRNGQANVLHSLITQGPQAAPSLTGAKGLHTTSPATMTDLHQLHAAGHIVPQVAPAPGMPPSFSITPQGGHALAVHMGGELTAQGQAVTTPPAAPPASADAAPQSLAEHNAQGGGKAGNTGEHKVEGGSEKAPSEAYHYEQGAATPSAPADHAAPAAIPDPAKQLPAPHAALLQHLADKGPMPYSQMETAHSYNDAVSPALDADHLGVTDSPSGKLLYGLSDKGKAALADHAGQTAAPPAETLPEGWKPISTKADKGYKTEHDGTKANVKPEEGGKFSVLTADARGEITHHGTFDSKEAAFGKAHEALGMPVKAGTEPDAESGDKIEGGDKTTAPKLPEGYTDDGEGHYTTGTDKGEGVVFQHTSGDSEGKWGSISFDKTTKQPIDLAQGGAWPTFDTAEEAFAHNQKTLTSAKAADGPAKSLNAPAAPTEKPAGNSPKLTQKWASEQAITALAANKLTNKGKVELLAAVKSGYLKTQADVTHVLSAAHKAANPNGSSNPATAGHVGAVISNHLDAQQGQTEKPAAAKEAASEEPSPVAPDAPSSAQHVTAFGVKHTLSNEAVSQADVDKAKSNAAPALADTAKANLQSAFDAGKLPTQGHLHQTMSMAEAVNAGGSYTHLTGYSVNKALEYGTVKGLKEKAEAGDAEAKAHVGKLGPTNIQSDKEEAEAAQAKAQEAFKNASLGDLTHTKTGGAAGSNDGGFYTTKSGQKVYAKFYKNADQAHSEHLANALYHALGVSAPTSTVKTEGGKTVYASQIIDGKTLGKTGLTKDNAASALQGFAADVLLGNRDAAGMGHDNMLVGEGGALSRIDNGGALLYRAKGAKKDASTLGSIREWDSFSNPDVASDYSKLFGAAGIDDADAIPGITKQIQAIEDIGAKPGGWGKFVSNHAPGMSAGEQKSVADMLTKRAALLAEKRKEIIARTTGLLPRDYKMATYAAAKKDATATHAKAITPQEKEGITAFKGGSYHSINAALRQTGGMGGAVSPVKDYIAGCDKLFARPESHLTKDLIVSRKLTVGSSDMSHYDNAQPGTVIEDPGFGSTSVNPAKWYGNYHLQLHLPKEANVVCPGVYTSSNEGEQEITLNRGHQYRILSIDPPGSSKLDGDPSGWSWESGARRVKAELIVPGINDDATKAKKSGKAAKSHETLTIHAGVDDGGDAPAS